MKKTIFFVMFLSFLFPFNGVFSREIKADYDVIPLPQKVETRKGEPFLLNRNTQIVYPKGNSELQQVASFLSRYIRESTGLDLAITNHSKKNNVILLQSSLSDMNKEAYRMDVSSARIFIQGASHAGVFYGVQTLRKSLPVKKTASVVFSSVLISDFPRFSYRGMHLDVSRHTFSVDSIKIYIDMMALHNMNRLHWHLTDDQGWRIEIKKYPALTKVGSVRQQTVIGKNSGRYDGVPYNGFYTQEEVRDIVKYAKERFVTIIPEIDLPGHMQAALAAYPNLGCTGGPYEVAESWGIFEDVLCAGNEDVYPFLNNIFKEIIDLFPSEYIHVGGDECPKTKWEKCPKCQAKIKELGFLKDEHHTAEEKLQSSVIKRVGAYIASRGRKIIGWDEILEGGAAPNSTIMSWRGTEGGIAAARQGHDAIMTPSSALYFNYYQSQNLKNEPLAIGGYIPVEKVYAYEPVPAELSDEQKKHIIGTQANVWTEYIKSFSLLQYMVLPRMAALAEIQWMMPENKNYNAFLQRLTRMLSVYKANGYSYAQHVFDVKDEVVAGKDNRQIVLHLSTFDHAPIYYTTDGSEPDENSTLYQENITIDRPVQVKAVAVRDGKAKGTTFERSFDINKGTFKPISLENAPWDKYTYDGAPVLVDGQKGGDVFNSGHWIGFLKDMIATIDLQEITDVSSVEAGVFVDTGSWIFNPSAISVEVSEDKTSFRHVFSENYEPVGQDVKSGAMNLVARFQSQKARYVRVTLNYLRSQPLWAGGAGKPASIFVDEIKIQ